MPRNMVAPYEVRSTEVRGKDAVIKHLRLEDAKPTLYTPLSIFQTARGNPNTLLAMPSFDKQKRGCVMDTASRYTYIIYVYYS